MEFLLLLWDEIDDWTGMCRHLAAETIAELSAIVAPLGSALLAGTATGWALLTHLHHFTGA